MSGEMCWLPINDHCESLVLYLRRNPGEGWRSYTHFPELKAPDYKEAGGSKGWATCQKLVKAGWKVIPTHEGKLKASPLASFR
jgi:hypothetical protein